MKNFFEGFVNYLKNIWDGVQLIAVMTALWFVMFIMCIGGSVIGTIPLKLYDFLFIDFFQGCTDLCKNHRQKIINKSIKQLPEGEE